MTVHDPALFHGVEDIEALIATSDADPRILHDVLRGVVNRLEANRTPVPADLRRGLEALEADIAEMYFNNLPV